MEKGFMRGVAVVAATVAFLFLISALVLQAATPPWAMGPLDHVARVLSGRGNEAGVCAAVDESGVYGASSVVLTRSDGDIFSGIGTHFGPYMVTAAHVVEDASWLVTYSPEADGRFVDYRVVYTDSEIDIAVLELDAGEDSDDVFVDAVPYLDREHPARIDAVCFLSPLTGGEIVDGLYTMTGTRMEAVTPGSFSEASAALIEKSGVTHRFEAEAVQTGASGSPVYYLGTGGPRVIGVLALAVTGDTGLFISIATVCERVAAGGIDLCGAEGN